MVKSIKGPTVGLKWLSPREDPRFPIEGYTIEGREYTLSMEGVY